MPISFSIDSVARFIRARATGLLRDGDLVEYLSRVLEHPAYEPGMSAIVDFSDVELGDFSAGAVRRLADFTRSLEDRLVGNRVAIVAPQPAVFGLARMYGLMRDPPYEVNVVRESSEAEAWLGRSDSDAPV